MKKSSLISFGFIVLSVLLYIFYSMTEDATPLKFKLGFLAKVFLFIGVVGFWLVAIIPWFGRKMQDKE